ncbi:hypothetical protein NC99_22270 [Sunxiuqinia dokdonensis]|uniref:Uncharacterized protein n=1 Tax=Sunxiuqinia dokdonensis TaxID=1409788 RepID=A0A0L8V8V2_9BACT|nr:hypothetical protein NC99_22270 [Sunxiuqinia dokdonensis]
MSHQNNWEGRFYRKVKKYKFILTVYFNKKGWLGPSFFLT